MIRRIHLSSSSSDQSLEVDEEEEEGCPYVLISKDFDAVAPTTQETIDIVYILSKFVHDYNSYSKIYISDNGTHWCGELCYNEFDHCRYHTYFWTVIIADFLDIQPAFPCTCLYCLEKQ